MVLFILPAYRACINCLQVLIINPNTMIVNPKATKACPAYSIYK